MRRGFQELRTSKRAEGLHEIRDNQEFDMADDPYTGQGKGRLQ
jgi:hypothetical protein